MQNKKIFIIEDDANILSGLQAKFSMEGFQIASDSGSENLEDIINKIRFFKADFVILDIVLPHVDGMKLLEYIKSDSHIGKPCVFIFTNLSDEDSRSRSEKLGADFFFIKNDFILDDFVAKIKKIIENRQKTY